MASSRELARATTKIELRRLLDRILRSGALKPCEKRVESYVVLHEILSHQKYREAKRISIYISTPNELDTIAILTDAFSKSKQCFVPYIGKIRPSGDDTSSPRMLMVELKSMSEYAKLPSNRWGIREPSAEFLTDRQLADPTLANLDLAIVPGLAFTKSGQRLGHGKGYYDEFLFDWANRSPKPLYTIGLALSIQIVDNVFAVEGQDYPLDEVLSAHLSVKK